MSGLRRLAVIVKQVPRFEAMALGPDGRLVREGLELELNPYCRRAVAKGAELAAARDDATMTVITLGPPAAEDVLREALAWADQVGARADAILVSDPAFAGSDTLATARALAAVLRRTGPYDLVLAGRNSVDSDTGQVGPEIAQLCDLPFLAAVRELAFSDDDTHAAVRCETDDGAVRATTTLPALLSVAERLCEPAKVDPPGRAAVDASRIRRLHAAELGPGPWGAAGSPTTVGAVRVLDARRAHEILTGSAAEQVRGAVALLQARGALAAAGERDDAPTTVAPPAGPDAPVVLVVVEPDRARVTRELLGAAADLGHAVALVVEPLDDGLARALAGWGAGKIIVAAGVDVEEDAARAVVAGVAALTPWAVLAPSTVWGREVVSRAAAALDAGLTGDAVALERGTDGRLIAWKPAFGGQLVAAITCSSAVQMATVRAGVLPLPEPRRNAAAAVTAITVTPRRRVVVEERTRDDDIDVLANASVVIGVGTGVQPDEYSLLEPLLSLLGAELAATRKVTDKGWLPRARQVGITGRSIAPRLYVAFGIAGKFNHMIGVRAAGTVLAVNRDPEAPVFATADIGITADWHEVVPLLVTELSAAGALR